MPKFNVQVDFKQTKKRFYIVRLVKLNSRKISVSAKFPKISSAKNLIFVICKNKFLRKFLTLRYSKWYKCTYWWVLVTFFKLWKKSLYSNIFVLSRLYKLICRTIMFINVLKVCLTSFLFIIGAHVMYVTIYLPLLPVPYEVIYFNSLFGMLWHFFCWWYWIFCWFFTIHELQVLKVENHGLFYLIYLQERVLMDFSLAFALIIHKN